MRGYKYINIWIYTEMRIQKQRYRKVFIIWSVEIVDDNDNEEKEHAK